MKVKKLWQAVKAMQDNLSVTKKKWKETLKIIVDRMNTSWARPLVNTLERVIDSVRMQTHVTVGALLQVH